MPVNNLVAITVALAAFLLFVRSKLCSKRPRVTTPPGPSPLPLIGNLLDVPSKRPWIQFREWSTQYGPVFCYRVFHKRVVVLNSREAITALLIKKGAHYSNRPEMTMLKKWAGWTWALPGLNGPEMLAHRRAMAFGLSSKACQDFGPALQRSSLQFAERVIRGLSAEETGGWRRWCRLMAAGNILNFSYGYDVQESNDPWIKRAERILELIQDLGPLGTHPVDVFPALSNLPQLIFGPRLAQHLDELRKLLVEVYELPYQFSKNAAEGGRGSNTFVDRMLLALECQSGSTGVFGENSRRSSQEVIKGVSATTYTVGVETVESSLNTFALAMVLNPEVQSWAQIQIDLYLKEQSREDDIPSIDDRSSAGLAAVEALLWEVLRWEPATPLAVAREAVEDDIYEGMLIPKGSIILANSWQCLHDPLLYPDPLTFNPKRFLPRENGADGVLSSQPDPREFAFGYGRRVCPGRYFAESTLWTVLATMLTLFTLEKSQDDLGVEIEPLVTYESGVAVQFPLPFRMSVKLRAGAEGKLKKALADLRG